MPNTLTASSTRLFAARGASAMAAASPASIANSTSISTKVTRSRPCRITIRPRPSASPTKPRPSLPRSNSSTCRVSRESQMRTTLAPADVRDAILDAAERLLARYGYRKMTMDDLACEAGIGKGTTYLHFPSKQEVVLCSIDRIVDRLLEQLRVIAQSNVAPAEKVRQMLRTRVLFRFD